MATRLYPSDTAYGGSLPAVAAAWEHNSQAVLRQLLRTPDTSALANSATTYDAADHLVDNDALHFRFVSDPLAPQNISGNVKAQFQALQNDDTDHLFLTYRIYIVSGDGSTEKETLLAITRDATEVPITTRTNRQLASTAISAADVEAGDRLVIDVGLGGTPTASGGTNDHDGSIRRGCSASGGDLPENDTETGTTFRPWVEFDDTIGFLTTSAPADTISFTEAEAEVVKKPRAETLGLSEAFSAVRVVLRSIGDTGSFVESFVKQVNNAIVETVGFTETFLKQVNNALAEQVALTEAKSLRTLKTVSDTLGTSELLRVFLTKIRGETVTLTENLGTVTIPGGGGGGAARTVKLSISVGIRLG